MKTNNLPHPPDDNETRLFPFDEIDIESSIPTRFEAVVERYPDNVAIKEEHSTITYRLLNEKANKVARAILAASDDPRKPIILLTESGSPAIITMLGALKTGKIHVLIDPAHPRERISDLLHDSQADVIVTDDDNINLAASIANSGGIAFEYQLVNVDKMDENLSDQNLGLWISPSTFANIFYTSGSTGKPKGVINNHRNILHGIYNGTNAYKITPDDHILLITSPGFSASTSDIFGALLNGAGLFSFPFKMRSFQQLAQWLVCEEITICHFVPTSFRHFVESLTGDEEFPNLRMIRLGGEAIYKQDVALFKKHFPDHCILRVGLASTEAGSICWNFIDKRTEIITEVVPVGYPVKGIELLLLDKDYQPVRTGEVGEIAVRSRYISPGYWHRPDLNHAKFLPDPDGGDRRICLTGDLGKILPDGTLAHVARKDTQVKIRGLRIETSEVEAVLLGLDTIAEAVVVAQTDLFNQNRLVAYIVPSDHPHPSISELRTSILEKLPDYMAPSSFVFLESLPLTPSGKINRLELPPPPEDRLMPGMGYVPPRNEVESQLVKLFEKHLEFHPIGVEDDFFELGGDSLLAIHIVSEIEEVFHFSLPIQEFIEAMNVENLAKKLQNQDASSSNRYLVALQPSGSKPPLFCVPPSAATAMQAEKLAKYLEADQPVYGFEYAGMDGKSEPFSSVQRMAEAFIQDIRNLQPKGPYYLCGLCFGGLVAFEIAQQLVAQGEKVAFLGVIDSNFPPRKKISFFYYYILTKQFISNLRGIEFTIPIPTREVASREFANNDPLKKRIQHVFTIHHIARMRYASPPYPGVITRFSTNSPHAQRTIRGWEKATSGGLDFQIIPGGHGARKKAGQTSFMREPNIQVLAQKLENSLKKARMEVGEN